MLAYCDYIADRVSRYLTRDMEDNDTLIMGVSKPKLDLHPTEGYMVSTKKTIEVQDTNGRIYLVTVEEKGLTV